MRQRSIFALLVVLSLNACARDYAFLDDVRDIDAPRADGLSPDGRAGDASPDASPLGDTGPRTDIVSLPDVRDVASDIGSDVPCLPPRMVCNGACVDTSSNANHCGSCALACPAGQICSSGVCGCAPGTMLCGASCIDIQSDANNCGGCNFRCPAGATCSAGTCGCPGGDTVCGSAPGTCVNTLTDPSYCGSCTNACSAPYSSCCGGGCVDLTTDYSNCGGCGQSCGVGSCQGGACVCSGTAVLCGTTCADVMNDSMHCGSCANACSTGQSCVNGACCNGVPLAQPCAGAFQCCDTTASCRPYSVGGTNLCCHEANQPCVNSSVCCGAMLCNGTVCACQAAGLSCQANADCCSYSCNASNICN